ncbi:MAG: peptidoglycan-associated lipoprotein Pal [Nitrospiria bacterium]
MRQGKIFLLVALGLFFSLEGCSKKLTSVSGTAGLSEERVENTFDSRQEERAEGRAQGGEAPGQEAPGQRERLFQGEESIVGLDGDGEDTKQVIADIFFEFNEASLRNESKEILQKNAELLMVNPGTSIQVQGHTDERGSEEYNLVLGARRARITKRFLEALGVNSSLINVISYGEERPFCVQSDERCWKQNRRAHFLIQSKR